MWLQAPGAWLPLLFPSQYIFSFLFNFLPVALFVFILQLPVVGVCAVSSLYLK